MSSWIVWLVRVVLISGFAVILYWLSGLPFWACLAIGAAALVVNGFVIEIEDAQPGGWSNPEGLPVSDVPTPSATVVVKFVRIALYVVLGILLVLGTVLLGSTLWHSG